MKKTIPYDYCMAYLPTLLPWKIHGKMYCKTYHTDTSILWDGTSPFLGILFLGGYTLQGINISHLGKRKIIFKSAFLWDMLGPRRVYINHSIKHICFLWLNFVVTVTPGGSARSRYHHQVAVRVRAVLSKERPGDSCTAGNWTYTNNDGLENLFPYRYWDIGYFGYLS